MTWVIGVPAECWRGEPCPAPDECIHPRHDAADAEPRSDEPDTEVP